MADSMTDELIQADEAFAGNSLLATFSSEARGLIVDSVSDIVTIASDSLQPPPPMSQDGVVPFLEGLSAIEDRMVMVLNLQALNADAEELAHAA